MSITFVRPGEPTYDENRDGLNRAVEYRPDVVVPARSAEDVVAAVTRGADRAEPVGVIATGHGPSVPMRGGTLVNTAHMKGVEVDPDRRTARIEAGARWEDVIPLTARHGLAPLNGSSPNVGVLGYVLGGGAGHLGRQYGFAADHVRSVDLVTADGSLRHVTAGSDPELFWAVRGAGANFGVAVAIEIDLFEVSRLYGGGLYFAGDLCSDVVHAYADWVRTNPDTMASSILLMQYPDLPMIGEELRGRFITHVRVSWFGPPDEGPDRVRPLRAVGPRVLDTVAPMPYTAIGTIHHEPVGEPYEAFDSNLLLRDLDHDAVDVLVRMAGPESGAPHIAELRHFGGAYRRQADPPNPVGGRDAAFTVYSGAGPDPADHRRRSAFEAELRPWATGGTLLNFMGIDGTDAWTTADAFSAADYARLRRAKSVYDPANRFRINHNIPPAG